jgi:hypothetical protein
VLSSLVHSGSAPRIDRAAPECSSNREAEASSARAADGVHRLLGGVIVVEEAPVPWRIEGP